MNFFYLSIPFNKAATFALIASAIFRAGDMCEINVNFTFEFKQEIHNLVYAFPRRRGMSQCIEKYFPVLHYFKVINLFKSVKINY